MLLNSPTMSDEVDSIIDFAPSNLSPRYTERLDDLTDELVEYPSELNREVVIKEEINLIESELDDEEPDPDRIRYLAVLEVLLDLIEIDYGIQKNSETRVVRPDMEQYREDPQKYKDRERSILQKERRVQFRQDSIKKFIRKMEGKSPGVGELIADNEDLHEDLASLSELERDEIIDELDNLIEPYVQVANKGEKCPHTGLDLMDIWRYFRYTWLTPYNTVPGRNINFLIRDAAREHHPVIGIASLASAMMNLAVRDELIDLNRSSEDKIDKEYQTLRSMYDVEPSDDTFEKLVNVMSSAIHDSTFNTYPPRNTAQTFGWKIGLLKPRGNRANRRWFQPNPELLASIVISAIRPGEEHRMTLPDFCGRLRHEYGIIVGGTKEDRSHLDDWGITVGSDPDSSDPLEDNYRAFEDILVDLGYATKYADGVTLVKVN